MRRGPVTPVCQINVPCDQPFAATFEVYQNSRLITTFRSASDGSFSVTLPPGHYTIVPSVNAPLMNPGSQRKDVDVRVGGNTVVTLTFDTGIR